MHSKNNQLKLVFVTIFTIIFIALTVHYFPAERDLSVTTEAAPETVIAKSALANLAIKSTTSESNLSTVMAEAEGAYALFLQTGNARYLEISGKLIARWSSVEQPPKPVWLLRARISQAKHQFSKAASDLENLLAIYPGSDYARLLLADAWRRDGKLKKSQSHCLMLAVSSRYSESKLCLTEVMLSKGDFDKAQSLLTSLGKSFSGMPPSLKQWFVILKSDLLSLQGQPQDAVAIWNEIDDWTALPYAYKLRLSDLLISQSLYNDATALLINERPTLAVLLRQYHAAVLANSPNLDRIAKQLERHAFISNNAPNKALHLYERALFAWWYENDAEAALSLAMKNWQAQKSYEDTALVMSLAQATDNDGTLKIISDWRAQW